MRKHEAGSKKYWGRACNDRLGTIKHVARHDGKIILRRGTFSHVWMYDFSSARVSAMGASIEMGGGSAHRNSDGGLDLRSEKIRWTRGLFGLRSLIHYSRVPTYRHIENTITPYY